MKHPPVLLLEFNELVPAIMERFMREGDVPNFRRLFESSEVFTTDAGTTDPKFLEPWIQWVTVHTGVDYDEHGILELSEAGEYAGKRIWDVVYDAGLSACLFGSMNIHCSGPVRGCVLPDPWNGEATIHPGELEPFYRFVKSNVQEHTKGNRPLGRAGLLEFGKFMRRHGLSFSTMAAIVNQLARERFGNHRWRRATILDRLQMDLFEYCYRRERPAFSTFFINSCAFLQHRYWRNYDPSAFKIKPSEQDQRDYGDAVRFGYQQLDAVVGRLMELVGPETAIVFATALSQQPHLLHEETGGKLAYRPHDYAAFLNGVGVKRWTGAEPVMVGQFHVRCEDEAAATAAETLLNSLVFDAKPAFKAYRRDDSVFVGCVVNTKVAPDALLGLPSTGQQWKFGDLLYQMDLVKSGRHHPDGILWIRTPGGGHQVHEGKVSLCGIAPTILSILGLPCPAEMRGSVLVGADPVAV
jgi:hypothetical protein